MAAARGTGLTLRALLVDDEEDLRELARLALELDGRWIVVGCAVDGTDAVRQAAESKPDLVLLDLEMPWLDGAEALPEIRLAVPDAVVVVWTAQPESARAQSAMELGAALVLGKNEVPVAHLADALAGAMRQFGRDAGLLPRPAARKPAEQPAPPATRDSRFATKVAAAVLVVAIAAATSSPAPASVALTAVRRALDVVSGSSDANHDRGADQPPPTQPPAPMLSPAMGAETIGGTPLDDQVHGPADRAQPPSRGAPPGERSHVPDSDALPSVSLPSLPTDTGIPTTAVRPKSRPEPDIPTVTPTTLSPRTSPSTNRTNPRAAPVGESSS